MWKKKAITEDKEKTEIIIITITEEDIDILKHIIDFKLIV